MTMVSSGLIALAGTGTSGGLNQSVEVELGGNGTTLITMNDSNVRTLAGVPSGAISLSNFYGKSNRKSISYTFSANTADATLNLSSISGYVAGSSDITITINSGVYLYATSTSSYGLNLSGGASGDTLTIVNNGYIMGQGGKGGSNTYDGTTNTYPPATAGSAALYFGFGLSSATITTSSGYIGGGGGGGGFATGSKYLSTGAGGAGGGAGGDFINTGSSPSALYGGTGGSPGSNGGNGNLGLGGTFESGGGGGRVMPGSTTAGPVTSGAGAAGYGGSGGGSGAAGSNGSGSSATGGSGGGSNSTGGNGTNVTAGCAGGGGGGYGASGGNGATSDTSGVSFIGASGGNAVALNGKSVTWTGGFPSTRVFGAVS